jgi:methionyl-tRNA synthetase
MIMSRDRILITSALPYVNNVPHMGNIIGCVLSADVFARYQRSVGNEVLFVCGTDEHGTATEAKAQEEGLTPRQICDKYYEIHRKAYEGFDISFDIFGRTSRENHHRIVQDIFKTLHKNGYILERDVEQAYCATDKKFLADRFVIGTCPHCKFTDARGDQCDNCSKLLDPLELIEPHCKLCGSTPEHRTSRHLFLDLPALQPKLQEWIAKQSKRGAWTQNATTTTNAWLERGLEPRAITRDLTWGVPVPLPGYEGKVFYVWFDAPIGYISITDQLEDTDWKSWWQDPDGVELYQFMAKDNIPFHTILFPATMIGTGEKWTMLHHIDATEYLQHEDGKFSKSRGVGLFADDALATGIPSDVYRYYLLINRPETSDTTFAWKDLQDKLNNELLANLGNLVNRTLKFLAQYADSTVSETVLDEIALNFRTWVAEEAVAVGDELAACKEKDALKRIMMISQKANGYFQEEQPWKTRTEDPERCARAMYVLTNTIKDLAIMLEPFLPTTSTRIFAQLGITPRRWEDLGNMSFHGRIGVPEALFARLEEKELTAIKEQLTKHVPAPVSVERKPLMIAAGRIVEVYRHPKADKLFVENVDFGAELGGVRTIVSGLVGHVREEDLRGKTFLFVANLAPANLRGVESHGMILAAQGKNEEGGALVEPVTVNAEPGTVITGEGTAQITIDEFNAHELLAVGGVVHIDGEPLLFEGKPIVTTKVKDGKVR